LTVDVHGIDEEAARKKSAPIQVWQRDGRAVSVRLRRAFARYQESLKEIWSQKQVFIAKRQGRDPLEVSGLPTSVAIGCLAVEAFRSEVGNARSLQHPAVGWLYAVERRGSASEFSWSAQVRGFLETEGKVGVPPTVGETRECRPLQRADDDETLYPEKQHVVPFAIARQVVEKGGTRATASPSNAIGNLTWLSRRQNGLDALADRWTVMDRERDGENLRARGMLALASVPQCTRLVLDVYHSLRSSVLDGTWSSDRAHARSLFAAVCEGRAKWLVDQMRDWLDEPLPDGATTWLQAPD